MSKKVKYLDVLQETLGDIIQQYTVYWEVDIYPRYPPGDSADL